jgi:hypothetical protein
VRLALLIHSRRNPFSRPVSSGRMACCATRVRSERADFTQRLPLESVMLTRLLSGSFLALGLLFAGVTVAADKPKDCCAAKAACCTPTSGCCVADTKLGCCDKGLKCCAETKGCCAAAQKCCTEGRACCTEAKACCGPTKATDKASGCCETKLAGMAACCASAK